jgi:hypothetical protein
MADGVSYTPEEAAVWEAQLSSAIKFKAKFGREDRWRRYIKRLAHRYYDGVQEESPTVNIMAARIRALVPQLAIGMPVVKVEATRRPDNPNAEPALSKKLEDLWATERMDDETRRCTLDAETVGIGLGFVGYETTWGERAVGANKRLFGVMPPSVTEKVSTLTAGLSDILAVDKQETVSQLVTERIFLERISPLNFAIDPTADHFFNASFMARRLFMTPKEAKRWFGDKAPRADSVANVGEWDSRDEDDPFNRTESASIENAVDSRVRRVMAWEQWDISAGKTVYLDRSGKVILVREWASPYSGFPIIPMLWDDIPDSVFPEGLAAGLEPLTNELHVARKRQLQELRKGIRKWKSSGPLSQKAKIALKSTNDGEVVEMSDYDQLEPLEHQPLPPDAFTVENRIKADMDEISMTSSNLASSQGPIRKTATESAFIQSAADAMIGYRQLMVERFAAQVLEVALAIITSVFDEPEPIKILNADPMLMDAETGQPIPVGTTIEYSFVGTDLAGYYKVKVEPGSMVAAAMDVERSQLLSMYERFAPETWFNKKAFGILIMSTMPSIRDTSIYVLDEVQPPQAPSPGAMQMPGLPQGQAPGGMMGPMNGAGLGASPPTDIPAYGEVNPTAQGDILSAVLGGSAPQMGM